MLAWVLILVPHISVPLRGVWLLSGVVDPMVCGWTTFNPSLSIFFIIASLVLPIFAAMSDGLKPLMTGSFSCFPFLLSSVFL